MDKSKYKILIVDDEKDVREILQYNVQKDGYQVFMAENGKEAIEKVKKEQPDLIILDVMMPEMNGYRTCTEIRRLNALQKTIIVFLTARNDDYSQITAFEAGGDDYVTKPVNPCVLLSRIQALLKRLKKQSEDKTPDVIEFGQYKMNKKEYMLFKNDMQIALPKKQFELLRLLLSRPNHAFTRDEIFAEIWGNEVIVGSRTIDVHIRKIREKTGLDNIITIKGVGYKLQI